MGDIFGPEDEGGALFTPAPRLTAFERLEAAIVWQPGDPDAGPRALSAPAPLTESLGRCGVAAMVTDGTGRLLLVRSRKPGRAWELPGGKVRADETWREALRREVREETGLAIALFEEPPRVLDGKRVDGAWTNVNLIARARASGEPTSGDDAAEARWFTGAEVPLSDLSDLASAKEIRYWAHVATETRPTAAPAPLTETEARTWALALEAKLGLDCPSFPGAYTDPLTAALLASNRGEIPSDVRTLNPPGAEGAVADRPLPPAERRELAAEMAIRAIEDTPPPYHAVWPTYDDGSDHDPKGGA